MKKYFLSQEDVDYEIWAPLPINVWGNITEILIKEDYRESKGQLHKIHIIFDPNELKTGFI